MELDADSFDRVIDIIGDNQQPIPLNLHWKYDIQNNYSQIYTSVERNVRSFISIPKQRVIRKQSRQPGSSYNISTDVSQYALKEDVLPEDSILLQNVLRQEEQEKPGVFKVPQASKFLRKKEREALLNEIQNGINTLQHTGAQIVKGIPSMAGAHSQNNSVFTTQTVARQQQSERSRTGADKKNKHDHNFNSQQQLLQDYQARLSAAALSHESEQVAENDFSASDTEQGAQDIYPVTGLVKYNQRQLIKAQDQQAKPSSPFPMLLPKGLQQQHQQNAKNSQELASNSISVSHKSTRMPSNARVSTETESQQQQLQSQGTLKSGHGYVYGKGSSRNSVSMHRNNVLDEQGLREIERIISEEKINRLLTESERGLNQISRRRALSSNISFEASSSLRQASEVDRLNLQLDVMNLQRKRFLEKWKQGKGDADQLKADMSNGESWKNTAIYKNVITREENLRKQELSSKKNNAFYSIIMLPKNSQLKVKAKLIQTLPSECRYNHIL